MLGFAPKRSIPVLYKTTLTKWAEKNLSKLNGNTYQKKRILIFNDEFTNYNDTETGIKTIKLLTTLGYHVEIPNTRVSGRTFLSKGLLLNAKKIANKNISILKNKIDENTFLLGIEPSAILSFRDEYIELATPETKKLH